LSKDIFTSLAHLSQQTHLQPQWNKVGDADADDTKDSERHKDLGGRQIVAGQLIAQKRQKAGHYSGAEEEGLLG
jgi:hypothetical protein